MNFSEMNRNVRSTINLVSDSVGREKKDGLEAATVNLPVVLKSLPRIFYGISFGKVVEILFRISVLADPHQADLQRKIYLAEEVLVANHDEHLVMILAGILWPILPYRLWRP
jgi:hypothetical protein